MSASCSAGVNSFAIVTVRRALRQSRSRRLALPTGMIEVEFATGTRLRIGGPIDAATVSAAITALARSERRR